jgi:hypothetical protein
LINSRALILLFLFGLICQKHAYSWPQTISEKATNPITNLSQMQFESDYSPKNYGSDDISNIVTIKSLTALKKTDWFPFEQLIRLKFQIPTLPNSSITKKGTSLGDTQIFDLFIIEEPEWGRWGIGPMAIFPTATTNDAGQEKWLIGPALGISVLKFTSWQFGFLAQNPISVAGNHNVPNQNYLLFQPFIIYHFLRNSYLITNAECTFDWVNHAQQIPVNIGIGHTFTLFNNIKIDSCLQFEWMAFQNATRIEGFVPQETIQFSFSLLLGD